MFFTDDESIIIFDTDRLHLIHLLFLYSIIFQGVRKEDDGFYICSALSVAGSSVTKAYLEVTAIEDQPPPIIAMGPANQTLPINTIAVLPCQASGNPKPSIRWFKDQKAITQTESSRLMVEETGTLVIDSKDDAYIYYRIQGVLT